MTIAHDSTSSQQLRAVIIRAWTEQLYREYEAVLFHYRVRLKAPLICVVETSHNWGQWSASSRTLSISQRLIEAYSWDIVIEILKHEMAHQMVTDHFGEGDRHGPLFRRACRLLGVAEWAQTATGELPMQIPNWRERSVSDVEERLLKRAEKLLALAESSNEHEASLAMQRVRQLYAKYQLEGLAAKRESEHVTCIIKMKKQRIEAVESMIFSVLTEHFFVRSIFINLYDADDRCDYKAVELLGSRENVLMAEYVHSFLKAKLDGLWRQFRAQTGKPAGARRSYQLGLLEGFRKKMNQQVADGPVEVRDTAENRALMQLADHALSDYVAKRHPRLATRRSGGTSGDASSYLAGIGDGGKITIHRGVTGCSTTQGLALPARGGR